MVERNNDVFDCLQISFFHCVKIIWRERCPQMFSYAWTILQVWAQKKISISIPQYSLFWSIVFLNERKYLGIPSIFLTPISPPSKIQSARRKDQPNPNTCKRKVTPFLLRKCLHKIKASFLLQPWKVSKKKEKLSDTVISKHIFPFHGPLRFLSDALPSCALSPFPLMLYPPSRFSQKLVLSIYLHAQTTCMSNHANRCVRLVTKISIT